MVNKFLNEAFESSMGTQRSAMGDYKKFCIALTTVGLPNLIAFDLVSVSPMSSMYGNVAYIEYVKGTDKGESSEGDMVNSVWELGTPDVNYTGQAVVETLDSAITNVSGLAFGPVTKLWKQNNGAWEEVTIGEGGAIASTSGKVKYFYDNVIIPQEKLPTLKAQLKNIGLEAKARKNFAAYTI